MARIDVTLVVPCYNVEPYLDQALTSAEQNDRCNLEIIAINDGSTDGSLAIMREHAAHDARIRVIDKPNSGYGANCNIGFASARGTYLAILEPDDYVRPHMYDRLYEFALRYAQPDIVKSAYWNVTQSPAGEVEAPCSYFNCVFPPHQPFRIAEEPTLIQQHPSIWSALYRRDFIDRPGIRLKEVPGGGWVDTPFLVQTMCQAESIVYLNECLYCYREQLPGSSSAFKLSDMPFERWQDMADVLRQLGVTDRGVWQSLYIRGFDYVQHVVENGGMEDPHYAGLVRELFAKWDPALMDDLPVVVPERKRRYYEVLGKPVPADLDAVYRRGKELSFAKTLRYYGMGAFLARARGVAARSAGAGDGE